jgi:hypothetical protein
LLFLFLLLSSDGDGRRVVAGVNDDESTALGITDILDDCKLARNIVFSLLKNKEIETISAF